MHPYFLSRKQIRTCPTTVLNIETEEPSLSLSFRTIHTSDEDYLSQKTTIFFWTCGVYGWESMELIGDTDAQECLQRLKRFVNQQGLGNFYDVTTLTAKATVAATMRRGMNRQYNWELASEFITLTLYDIAILIGLGPDLFYSIPTSRTIAPGRQPHQTPRQTGNIGNERGG